VTKIVRINLPIITIDLPLNLANIFQEDTNSVIIAEVAMKIYVHKLVTSTFLKGYSTIITQTNNFYYIYFFDPLILLLKSI